MFFPEDLPDTIDFPHQPWRFPADVPFFSPPNSRSWAAEKGAGNSSGVGANREI
jgi:hypothetical protein